VIPANPGATSVGGPNPGDVLGFNPEDLDGRHQNNRFRAGEFFLYDEYEPLRKIQLDSFGNLWKPGAGTAYEFLLNFNETEGAIRPAGTVPKATGQQTSTYPQVNDDGTDAIFGDNGNDWLVGGTGRDDLYGGWGNDLLNADDNQTTDTNANDQPDTHPTYEDRAYGGAGRDVLIANTGGDRLIDWVGEYNSYLVPYAPFGEASVSRTMQPFLPEFLYALSPVMARIRRVIAMQSVEFHRPQRTTIQSPAATENLPANWAWYCRRILRGEIKQAPLPIRRPATSPVGPATF